MNKTVLVIGSVTAKQYEPIRLFHISNGVKPRILRLSYEAMQRIVSYAKQTMLDRDGIEAVMEPGEIPEIVRNRNVDDVFQGIVKQEIGVHLNWNDFDVIYDAECWKLCSHDYWDNETLTGFTSNCQDEYVIQEDGTIMILMMVHKNYRTERALVNW